MVESGPDESIEGLRIDTETIRHPDLLKRIEANGERDPRFLPWNTDGTGGVFEFSPFEDEEYSSTKDAWYSLVTLNGLIVGLALIEYDADAAAEAWLHAVSIDKNLRGLRRSQDPEEQKMRLSERLLLEVFDFIKKNNVSRLHLGDYSDKGKERLEQRINQLAEANNITVHEY